MFGNIINQLKPQKTKDLDEVDGSSNSLSRLPTNLSLSSVSLNSIKSQTAKVSSQLFTSLKSQSDRVSKLIWNEPSEVNDSSGNDPVSPEPKKYPTLLEQLKWPVLVNNRKYWLPYINNDKTDEEDIVEKFIRVIRSEDDDERPQETFYNHPERVMPRRSRERRELIVRKRTMPYFFFHLFLFSFFFPFFFSFHSLFLSFFYFKRSCLVMDRFFHARTLSFILLLC